MHGAKRRGPRRDRRGRRGPGLGLAEVTLLKEGGGHSKLLVAATSEEEAPVGGGVPEVAHLGDSPPGSACEERKGAKGPLLPREGVLVEEPLPAFGVVSAVGGVPHNYDELPGRLPQTKCQEPTANWPDP
eukprot:4731077-Alexandrium_andersonii.AAC.1